VTALLFLAGIALLALAFVLWQQRRRNAVLQHQLDLAAAELQQLQQACSRLAPAGVVDRMVADGLHVGAELPAERKVVTALFSDLVGFTAMSEKLEPPVLARILDGYFQRVSDAVHAHSGHVSTWLGDGMLAYFGALRPNPWQCADAVRCALAMGEAILLPDAAPAGPVERVQASLVRGLHHVRMAGGAQRSALRFQEVGLRGEVRLVAGEALALRHHVVRMLRRIRELHLVVAG